MSSPFPLTVMFQNTPDVAAGIQQKLNPPAGPGPVRFGGSGGRIPVNALPDGQTYTIQVKDSQTLRRVAEALISYGATARAWISVTTSAGPQWRPINEFIHGSS